MKDRSELRKDAEPIHDAGDFRRDGSWETYTPAAHRGALYAFIKRCVQTRRISSDSPAQLAASIKASPWLEAFPVVQRGDWDRWDRYEDWQNTWTSTSAEETIKRDGRGNAAHENYHWQNGGSWYPGEDARSLPPVQPDEISSVIRTLGKAIG